MNFKTNRLKTRSDGSPTEKKSTAQSSQQIDHRHFELREFPPFFTFQRSSCNFLTMSAKSTAQIDAKREEFRKYLEKEGVLESLTKALVRTAF